MTKLYLEDKEYKNQLILDAFSECCHVPTNSDVRICSYCKEHCGVYFEEIDSDFNDLYQ